MVRSDHTGAPKSVRQPLDAHFIQTGSLRTVFEYLYRQRMGVHGQLDGSLLAHVLQRLITAEVTPGGPYQEPDGSIDPLANAYIAHFLALEGVQLPNLQPFIMQYDEATLRSTISQVPVVAGQYSPVSTMRHAGLLAAIDKRVRIELLELPEPLDRMGSAAFERLLKADASGEIRLMPQLFLSSLAVPPRISRARLARLGAANVFFWIGGMLFDDFLDGEGRPERLPIATVLHRRALALYRHADTNPAWHKLLEDYCNQADRANAWEVTMARAALHERQIAIPVLPDYGNGWPLADRSLGHLLGPLYVLRQAGVTRRQTVAAWEALRRYLIVRQLNDDLHDWRDDMLAGQITMVATILLEGCGIAPGTYPVSDLVPRLERYFFDKGLEEVCALAYAYLADARMLLANAGIMKGRGGIYDLLDRQEATVRDALTMHANRRAFIRTITA